MTEATKQKGNKSKHKTSIARDARKKVRQEVVKKDAYTPEEQVLVDEYKIRSKKKPLKYTTIKGKKAIVNKGEGLLALAKMTAALGTPDSDLQNFFIDQVVKTFKGCASSEGFCENKDLAKLCSNAIAILQGINPKDEIEGMLSIQMIAVHNMIMYAMGLSMISDQFPEAKERNISRAVKLLRIFSSQIEALTKYRTRGQQRIVVDHVHIHQGGQAIVGSVTHGGGGNGNK